ncbi:hypothetical protein FA13DRAFT_1728203 [Coprinellus micaceus]|uniref:Uncharacterized protein n=1 Tax=Coprinellus micaceus TaxID=71717 RepID=A0A4Y7TN71_COPMI|nr:hypothetical protein FA13DRAFT_1728203 [Coprinellus micaceus]
MPNDTELANQVLVEERQYRWGSFDSADALALGLSIRKRFRSTPRHLKGNRGCLISIQTIAGHTLFSCTVGDLGHPTGSGDVVSLDSWSCLEGMVAVVKRVGHSSFYVEKGMSAMGKTPKQLGVEGSDVRICGGAFPIWLENAPCCPIAIAACYSGSSHEDHTLVATTIRDYLAKQKRPSETFAAPTNPEQSMFLPPQHMHPENPAAQGQSWFSPTMEQTQQPQDYDQSRFAPVDSPSYQHQEETQSTA